MTSPGKEMIVLSPPPSKETHNSAIPSKKNNVPSTSIIVNPNTPLPWSSGLCDCFNDCENCCLTYCCPCVTFGRIAEIVDRGSTPCGVSGTLYLLIMLATGCSCIYSCFYRSKMRGQFFLEESPCTDICIHCWCEPCALCQEYRELQNRGFDPSIGWYGNMESQRRTMSIMAPPMPGAGGMNRR